QRADAVACLQAGLKALPREYHVDLLWTLTNVLLDMNGPKELAQAREYTARLRQVYMTPGAVDCLDARLLMAKGEWARAVRILERVRPRLEAGPQLTVQLDLFLARCYEQLDDPVRRQDAYERAAKANGPKADHKSGAALLGWASALWAMDKP